MAIHTTSTVTSGVNIQLAASEPLFIPEGVVRASSADTAVEGLFNNHEVTVHGTLYGDSAGLQLGDVPGALQSSEVMVGPHGAISGRLRGVLMYGSRNNIDNSGLIEGLIFGLSMQGEGDFRLVNAGTMRAPIGTAIQAAADSPVIVNHGAISGQTGIFLSGMTTPQAGRIVNTGTVTATEDNGAETSAILVGLPVEILNSGGIFGDVVLFDEADAYRGRGEGLVEGTIFGAGGDDSLFGAALADVIEGGADDDWLLGRGGGDDLKGESGADTIRGGTGDDSIDGGDGDDLLGGGAGDDDVAGGAGGDTLFGAHGRDTLAGNTGDDEINAGAGDDSVRGDNQDDTIRGQAGDDTLDGGSGQDTVLGGWGADEIAGGLFEDLLGGGAGDDTIDGGNGDDTIHGGDGDDEITTGDGADDIVIRKGMGHDLVTDFTDGLDQVDVRALNLQNFGDLQAKYTVVEHQNAVFLDFGDGDTLMLDGVALADLAYGDFVWF